MRTAHRAMRRLCTAGEDASTARDLQRGGCAAWGGGGALDALEIELQESDAVSRRASTPGLVRWNVRGHLSRERLRVGTECAGVSWGFMALRPSAPLRCLAAFLPAHATSLPALYQPSPARRTAGLEVPSRRELPLVDWSSRRWLWRPCFAKVRSVVPTTASCKA